MWGMVDNFGDEIDWFQLPCEAGDAYYRFVLDQDEVE